MDEYNSFLVTILYRRARLRCAVKTKLDFSDMSKEEVWAELPAHVKSCGPVVKVERIFDIALSE